jgi:pre-mRNA-splicing factor 38A
MHEQDRILHGTVNLQNLVEKITRMKIYNSMYWKEKCFGLSAGTLLDKAVEIRYCGGIYGGNAKPTAFISLVLKMLQLQPERSIVLEFIYNEDFKYLRALGAYYLRLTANAEEIYELLEPLYNDYRKLVFRSTKGWEVKHMDEFIDDLLHQEMICDIVLPVLQARDKVKSLLTRRRSALDELLLNECDMPLLFDKYDVDEPHGKRAKRSMRHLNSDGDVTGSEIHEQNGRGDGRGVVCDSGSGGEGEKEKGIEGSVEYWNIERAKLGLDPLK